MDYHILERTPIREKQRNGQMCDEHDAWFEQYFEQEAKIVEKAKELYGNVPKKSRKKAAFLEEDLRRLRVKNKLYKMRISRRKERRLKRIIELLEENDYVAGLILKFIISLQ